MAFLEVGVQKVDNRSDAAYNHSFWEGKTLKSLKWSKTITLLFNIVFGTAPFLREMNSTPLQSYYKGLLITYIYNL